MSLTEKHPARSAEDAAEARREELRRLPGVVVHERRRFDPFVPSPQLRVVGPLDVRELMGRCDPDDDAERVHEDE